MCELVYEGRGAARRCQHGHATNVHASLRSSRFLSRGREVVFAARKTCAAAQRTTPPLRARTWHARKPSDATGDRAALLSPPSPPPPPPSARRACAADVRLNLDG